MLDSLLFGQIASFSVSLADPAGSSPVVAAVRWLEGTLLGTIALTVAIISVATIGVMMLSGRVNLRFGATAILGCFILFGASSIVAGIQSALAGGEGAETIAAIPPTAPVVIPPAAPGSSDPYAGASLPQR